MHSRKLIVRFESQCRKVRDAAVPVRPARWPETPIWEASLCRHYVNTRAPSLHFRLNQPTSHHPATQSQIWPIRADSERHPSLAPKGLTPAVWTRSLGEAGSRTGISIMGSDGPKI